MLQQESILEVADNTGAKTVKCVKVLGGTRRRYAGVGDKIICSVQEASPDGQVKKKEVLTAIIVRTSKPIKRKDGSYIAFDDNACVIIDDKSNPRGTRIFGPIAKEVKEAGHLKICSMAEEVI